MSTLNSTHNRIVWSDIPVANLDRAAEFYAAVLGVPIHKETMEHFSFCVIDHQDGNGGCLMELPEAISATQGLLVYFNANGRIRDAVAQAEKRGGRVVEPIHSLGPHGFRAVIVDSEGNRVALHSETDA